MKKYNYNIIFSKRKTIELQINKNFDLIVRAPKGMSKATIDDFVTKHDVWIQKTLKKIEARENSPISNIDRMTNEEHELLRKKAVDELTKKVEYYSQLMKLYPTDIKITSAKTRWGSCSSKNSICFSYRLMAMPERFIDYVVVHELAHIKEKNHSKNFYDIVKQYIPEYREIIASVK